MFRRLRNRLYNKIEEDYKFKVKYQGKLNNLILTDEYLKIGILKFHYESIVQFGYSKNIFYFTKRENKEEEVIYVISKNSIDIHNKLYKKCLELVEFQEPIINISSLPDPPSYKPYN